MTDPLINRQDIEQIMRAARVHRARYFREKSAEAARTTRFAGLTLLIASTLGFFSTHGSHQTGSTDPGHGKFSRYY